MAVSSKTLDQVFGALSHPSRRQILVVLFARGGTMNAGEIADRFKHSWPTITRHLGVLEAAKLLKVSRSGRNRVYQLQTGAALFAVQWIVGWAASDELASSKHPDWKKLSYATMRNAVPPQKASGKKKKTGKVGKKANEKKTPRKKRRP